MRRRGSAREFCAAGGNCSGSPADFGDVTPLKLALQNDHEDIALYLLSLGDGNPQRLDLERRTVRNNSSLLTLAAKAGMVRVVEALLGHGVNLLSRDTLDQLAVCRAVEHCRVEVMNVLLEAHARQGGEGGLGMVLECPCVRSADKEATPLLFHAISNSSTTSLGAQLAIVRCLVQQWAVMTSLSNGRELYPIFCAARTPALNVVAFFLDECGIDVNMTTPRTKETVLHALVSAKPPSK